MKLLNTELIPLCKKGSGIEKMKQLFQIIFFFISQHSFAQGDSVAYTHEYEFDEGVFLTENQFKQNNPIPKLSIVSDYPKSQSDFLDEVITQKNITFKDASGKEQKVETATIWGYCKNRTIYLNFNKEFSRLNVIGSLCYFTATVRTVSPFRDPMNYNYGMNTTYDELRQFVYDTETNEVLDFNVKNMETLLMRDSLLHNQFMALKKRDKPDAIFIYLRKYNERHPLYLTTK